MGDIDRIVRLTPTVQAPLAAHRSGDAPRRDPGTAPHGGHEDALELHNVLEDEPPHQGPPPPPEEPGHLDLAV